MSFSLSSSSSIITTLTRKILPICFSTQISSPSSSFLRQTHHGPPSTTITRTISTPNFCSMSSNFSYSDDSMDKISCSCSATDHELRVSDSDDDDEVVLEPQQELGNGGDSGERWNVLGLGQAMVDFSGMVDDEFLDRLGLVKGTRKVVNHEERGRVLRVMDGCNYKAAAGGSLSNTLVALARLGCPSVNGPSLKVAMAGSVGSDPLGGFFRSKLRRANVNFLSAPVKDGQQEQLLL